ncbi:MAG: helix-turn-helix domain-containing protein [Chloroflexota bacterium]
MASSISILETIPPENVNIPSVRARQGVSHSQAVLVNMDVVAGHEKQDFRAQRQARENLAALGQEIRIARLSHDLSQSSAGRAIAMSTSAWSRMERGAAQGLSLSDLTRALAVVGLSLNVRAYPGGQPLRDQAHLQLLARFRQKLGAAAQWRTEVPMPNPGDLRAWDALVLLPSARIGIEAETRARDAQGLQRRLALKRRDGGVDHLFLLLADTRHNRAFLRVVGEGFLADFPLDGRTALKRLAPGEDPGGSAIVLA